MYSRAGAYPGSHAVRGGFSPNTAGGVSLCGLGHVYEVTQELMVPDPSLSIRERAIASWPPAWHGQNACVTSSSPRSASTTWTALARFAQKDRDWILYTEESPTVPVYPGFTPAQTRAAVKIKLEPGYMGTFTGARRYVLHTFANSQSALMEAPRGAAHGRAPVPTCHGKRLKPRRWR